MPHAARWSAISALLLISAAACGQEATTLELPRDPRQQFSDELDSLLRSGVSRPYGLGWSATPEPAVKGAPPPQVSYEPGATPAAGLLLYLGGKLLDEPRFSEAALQVAHGIAFSMDTTGRVPGSVAFQSGHVSNRELHGQTPRRPPTTSALAFLLLFDRDTASSDPRAASATIRACNWLVKQQFSSGAYVVEVHVPGRKEPRKVVRLDLPETRDALLTALELDRVTIDRDTRLPVQLAKTTVRRSVDLLLKYRISEMGRLSRNLWPSAYDTDGLLVVDLPDLPAAGNFPATNYAIQSLLAYHLESNDKAVLDVIKLASDAVLKARGDDGRWPLIDDQNGRFLPPNATTQPVAAPGTFVQPALEGWPRGKFGLPATLDTVKDLRVLGRSNFLKLTSRTLPPELTYAAIVTGLTDELPTADLPLSPGQVAAYVRQHPGDFDTLRGPEPVELTARVKRLWCLYQLATWQQRPPAAPSTKP